MILLHYGTKTNIKQYNTFMEYLQHFTIESKELDHCKNGLEGEVCFNQVKEELGKISYTTVIVLLNSDYNLINGVQKAIINKLHKSNLGIIASQNVEKFGVNIVGSYLSMIDIIKPIILDQNYNILQPFIDHTDEIFSNVDLWKVKQIFGKFSLSKFSTFLYE